MKFTLALSDLESMLKAVSPSRARKDDIFTLSACAARVFVEYKGNVGGMEALVFDDGAVTLALKSFRELLTTYKGTRHLHFEGDRVALRLGSLQIPILGYEQRPRPPGNFTVFPVTDVSHQKPGTLGRT